MIYDVGEITKTLQSDFKLFGSSPSTLAGNHATPERLAVLVLELEKLTADIEARRAGLSDWLPDAGVAKWDADMAKWKGRLGLYRAALTTAHPRDRSAVLWSVTAPLLMGFYGGPDSKLPQQPLDAFTPFSLANQLDDADAWRTERWNLLLSDLHDGLAKIPDAIPGWVWAGLGLGVLAVGAYVVAALRPR